MPRNKLSSFDKSLREQISKNLKQLCENMTQSELSELTGIPESTISGYFAMRSTPNSVNVQKIAAALNVRKSDIDPRFSAAFLKEDSGSVVADALNTTIADLIDQDAPFQDSCCLNCGAAKICDILQTSRLSNKEIGRRLTEARENIEVTRKELAEMVGIAASTITRYEKGAIKNIKLPVIESIIRALKINPMWIFGKSECRNISERHAHEDSYKFNSETVKMAEQLRTNANLRMLFKALIDLDSDKVKEVYNYVEYLKFKDSK